MATVSNFKQIHDHPLNHSSSKNLWSFSKSKRFSSYAKKSPCQVLCYDIDPKNYSSQRKCSLGKGKKYDFTKNLASNPAPNQYNSMTHTIEYNLKKNKRITFGESRQKCKLLGTRDEKFDKIFPGPGQYPLKSTFSEKKSASFRIKTNMKNTSENDLGPGFYDYVPTIGERSKLLLS